METLDKKQMSEILAVVVAVIGIVAVLRAVFGRR